MVKICQYLYLPSICSVPSRQISLTHFHSGRQRSNCRCFARFFTSTHEHCFSYTLHTTVTIFLGQSYSFSFSFPENWLWEILSVSWASDIPWKRVLYRVLAVLLRARWWNCNVLRGVFWWIPSPVFRWFKKVTSFFICFSSKLSHGVMLFCLVAVNPEGKFSKFNFVYARLMVQERKENDLSSLSCFVLIFFLFYLLKFSQQPNRGQRLLYS